MAILQQIPKDDLGVKWTHYGWFAGMCPIYINKPYSESPEVTARNWIPEWWLDFVTWLYGCFIFICTVVNDDYEPMWPMVITGEIASTDGDSEHG